MRRHRSFFPANKTKPPVLQFADETPTPGPYNNLPDETPTPNARPEVNLPPNRPEPVMMLPNRTLENESPANASSVPIIQEPKRYFWERYLKKKPTDIDQLKTKINNLEKELKQCKQSANRGSRPAFLNKTYKGPVKGWIKKGGKKTKKNTRKRSQK